MDIFTDSHHISRLEIVDTGRRRRWSEEAKLRIVEESFSGPRLASATARRHRISTQQLFSWRKAYREGLEQHREQALLSKELVTIHTELPLTLDVAALRHEPPDTAALRALYGALEFETLLAELGPEATVESEAIPAARELTSPDELATLLAAAGAEGDRRDARHGNQQMGTELHVGMVAHRAPLVPPAPAAVTGCPVVERPRPGRALRRLRPAPIALGLVAAATAASNIARA